MAPGMSNFLKRPPSQRKPWTGKSSPVTGSTVASGPTQPPTTWPRSLIPTGTVDTASGDVDPRDVSLFCEEAAQAGRPVGVVHVATHDLATVVVAEVNG